ncbi:uncharacterized protein KY384_008460 [Bacidia gigantensis]|uniref:uncharacterized protein n=1 Tax=Bacidia gigantensis TaxID=2732470 RepID=UPI001D04CFF6|nr:uncharacterized protein KY384_008460 [Bacidia gigantensis]KAG8527031.1 hypothetical protein KY384_008460 [Bacidia gigantensis]
MPGRLQAQHGYKDFNLFLVFGIVCDLDQTTTPNMEAILSESSNLIATPMHVNDGDHDLGRTDIAPSARDHSVAEARTSKHTLEKQDKPSAFGLCQVVWRFLRSSKTIEPTRYYVVPAEPGYAKEMVDVFITAHTGQGLARYEATTNMCNSLVLSDKPNHVAVAQTEQGQIWGWVAVHELNQSGDCATAAKLPEYWQSDIFKLLLNHTRTLQAAHGFEPASLNLFGSPDERMAQTFLDDMFSTWPEEEGRNVLLLDTVVVHPEHAKRGIGTVLIKIVCGFADECDAGIVTVVPERAKHIFLKAGFVVVSNHKINWSDHYKNAPSSCVYTIMAYAPQD